MTDTQEKSDEVSDEEVEKAWGNADFGNVPKVDVIVGTLKKVAMAWGTGHTAMCIVKELGFVENRNNSIGLSDRGLSYLLKHSSTTSEPIKGFDIHKFESELQKEMEEWDEQNKHRSGQAEIDLAKMGNFSSSTEPIKDEELVNLFGEVIAKFNACISKTPNVNAGYLYSKECVEIAKQYAVSKTKDLQKDLDLAMSEIVKLQMNQLTQ